MLFFVPCDQDRQAVSADRLARVLLRGFRSLDLSGSSPGRCVFYFRGRSKSVTGQKRFGVRTLCPKESKRVDVRAQKQWEWAISSSLSRVYRACAKMSSLSNAFPSGFFFSPSFFRNLKYESDAKATNHKSNLSRDLRLKRALGRVGEGGRRLTLNRLLPDFSSSGPLGALKTCPNCEIAY